MKELNDISKIDYGYVEFTFLWNDIKDKQIIHKGNENGGMLAIADWDGNLIKMYGYEKLYEAK
jgi:hypothetical protein